MSGHDEQAGDHGHQDPNRSDAGGHETGRHETGRHETGGHDTDHAGHGGGDTPEYGATGGHEDSHFGTNPDIDSGVHASAPMAGRPRTQRASNFFASALRTRSSKGLAIFSAVVVLFGLFLAFRPVHHKKVVSSVESAPDISAPQGSAPASPAYQQALTESDQQRDQKAQQTGGSALPTVQGSQTTTPAAPAPQPAATGYKQPQATPPHKAPVIPSQPANSGQTTTAQAKPAHNRAVAPNVEVADQDRTQALVNYFQGLDPAPGKPQMVVYDHNGANGQSSNTGNTAVPPGNRAITGDQNGGQGNGAAQAQPAADPAPAATRPSGPYSSPAPNTVLYSILRFGVDSDAPGPVQAVIEQGKFRGARVLGSFQTTRNGDIIKFNTMTMPYTDANGQHRTQTLSIDAVAINPNTLNDNMATSVNDHMALRLAVAFGSALASNFGQLLTESGASTVISPTGAIATSNPTLSTQQQIEAAGGQAVGTAGNLLNQEYGQLPPTIKTAAGTPFALLFLKGSGQ